MLNINNPGAWVNWWNASCAWNDVMVQQAHDTAAIIPDNYRYYIGTGSRHTICSTAIWCRSSSFRRPRAWT